jgi:hypothetical protein
MRTFLCDNEVDIGRVHSTIGKADLNRKNMASDLIELDSMLLHFKRLPCCIVIYASGRFLSVTQNMVDLC